MMFIILVLATILLLSTAQIFSQKCASGQFLCNDGTCISSMLRCNGALDCSDGSDEDFTKCWNNMCRYDQFRCTYGGCVKKNASCDGVQDCVDNSDELHFGCRNDTDTYWDCLSEKVKSRNNLGLRELVGECYSKGKLCKNGQKIDLFQKCDGKVDCRDGSDETLETCYSDYCFFIYFKCKYGACVSKSLLCDGVKNCADGSDELDEICHANLCVLPAFPSNGYYTADLSNSYPGQPSKSVSLNYYCHSGYKLVGESSNYCKEGMWSSLEPKCVSQCWLKKHPSVEYLCLPKSSSSQEGVKECGDLVEESTAVRPKCRQPNYYSSGMLVNMHCIDGVWDQVTVCSPQCGLVTSQGDQLIAGGRTAVHGELPWHTGIYTKTTAPYMQICGGSIVSSTVVISAAHCFWKGMDKQLPASRYAIAVGKLFNYWNISEDEHTQRSDVLAVKIPPRFQGAETNFQDDIAMVIATDPFNFHTYVRPVCVDFEPNFRRRQLITGAIGKVAGWGFTSALGGINPELKVVELPVVDIELCISTAPPEFVEYITSDKFCAGYNNGTSRAVCKGDSGGGLAFVGHERGTARYYLRGLASTVPANDQLCNTQFFTTFTDISKHEEFIKDNM